MTRKLNLLKPMKKTYSKTVKALFVAMIMSTSVASLWAQDQIIDQTSLSPTQVSGGFTDDNSSLLPPMPTPDTDFQPSFVSQSFTIQSVPEPSTIALGSLAFGLIAVVHVIRKYRPASLN